MGSEQQPQGSEQQPQSTIDRIVRETLGNQLATFISLQAQLEEMSKGFESTLGRVAELEKALQDADNQDAKTED